ncbi:2-iminoacetate synthase ThiH [Calditerrivibrio nitroreducens]|uniref:Tyrosine lyase ThiH n=1 Tax=Calditerrivibrio nitroreducens (strain DSM 19672 / NBRC 101217 / Yu37-1) TaxID=768670 RepID=E4TEZ5_CALNY|nr:2-iminoacetate synthase ThiH [Calditerrivibrio nitroreducens]ADR18401.1 tyrosine lyase ThiH [Calditerrivibrio nitroreducens DSM 19672]
MSFFDIIANYKWEEVKSYIYSRAADDVIKALNKTKLSDEDFAALLSPAAESFLENMARLSKAITLRRFGKTIQLYAPLYLSNECTNSCVYCGFNRKNVIPRKTLTFEEVDKEAKAISSEGIKHILLVSGESPKHVNMEYLKKAAEICKNYFSSISIEIQPLPTEEYNTLYHFGVDGLTIYQETYNMESYKKYHLGGKKTDYRWRLDTPERGAEAGFRSVGLGALMGLEDFRVEEFFVGLHARYLMKKYWKTHIKVSFPRIRYAEGGFKPEYPVSDRNLLQSMFALRIFLNDVGLVISTREPAEFRDNILGLGVTQMSAGSKTNPGGYTEKTDSGQQFSMEDTRSVKEFVESLQKKGFDPVFKDFDQTFMSVVA